MTTRLIAVVLFCLSIGCSGSREASSPRPNVLLIIVDDLNTKLGSYGDPEMRTPNMDQLAMRGRRFDYAFTQFPLCNPSRTSFMTGLRPDVTRVWGNQVNPRQAMPEMLTLPQYFRQQGYLTVSAGKVFHHDDPPSWEHALSPAPSVKNDYPLLAAALPGLPRKQKPREDRPRHLGPLDLPDEMTLDGKSALAAAHFLEQEHEKPFLLAIGLSSTHAPWHAPKKYFEFYQANQMKIPSPDDLSGLPNFIAGRTEPSNLRTDRQKQLAIQAYSACISFVDAQVGVILAALRKSDYAETTIIGLWSDHGILNGEHGLWGKNALFEETTRVPLILLLPGMKRPGQGSGSIVELVDLFPTLVDLCGLPQPKGLMGRSLRSILNDPSAVTKEAAISVMEHDGALYRSIRTAEWRYTGWAAGGAELYDHRLDAGEHHNLARDPRYKQAITALQNLTEQLR